MSELILLVIVSWYFCPPMIDSHRSEPTSDFFIIGRLVIRDRGPRSKVKAESHQIAECDGHVPDTFTLLFAL